MLCTGDRAQLRADRRTDHGARLSRRDLLGGNVCRRSVGYAGLGDGGAYWALACDV